MNDNNSGNGQVWPQASAPTPPPSPYTGQTTGPQPVPPTPAQATGTQPVPPTPAQATRTPSYVPAPAQAAGMPPALPAYAYAPGMPPAPSGYGQPYPPVFMPSPPQKKGKAWIVALAVVAAFFILSILGMNSCSNAFSSAFTSSASTDSADYLTQDAVAIINIDGTIQYDGSNSSPEGLKYQLDRAETNPHIKAVVLRINSGGGVATAGEEMALYVKQFSKPIVVSSASINASAAYEISSQADYIFTAKTTAIGSIGTAMSITDLSGLYEKLGIHIDDITSAESKDSSYGNRPLTEEERAYYQDMVNEINETFIKTVAEGRGMTVEEVRVLATGLTFTGMTGVQNGLADSIGTLEDAVVKAAELSYIQGGYTTVYLYSGTSLSMLDLLGILGSASSQQDVLGRLKELEGNGSFAN